MVPSSVECQLNEQDAEEQDESHSDGAQLAKLLVTRLRPVLSVPKRQSHIERPCLSTDLLKQVVAPWIDDLG